MTVVDAYLGLGSNVGDRLETLTSAVFALHESDGIAVREVSGIYETEPWGGVVQKRFYNCAVAIRTSLPPRDLLAEIQLTEAAFGRDRPAEERWGPRTLDIDILLYDDLEIDEPDLVIPHPRLAERVFVLVPLLEVMPGGSLPDGRRLSKLLNELAPVAGIDLVVRLTEVPGAGPERPPGPGGTGPVLAEDWTPPRGPAPGVER